MMENRILKAGHGDYVKAEYSGSNDSLEHPVGRNLIVKVDTVAEKIGSIHVPGKTIEVNTKAVTTGVIVAMGDNAFETAPDGIHPWKGRKPEIGDRITFKRYEGEEFQDGRPFHYMPDSAVRGIHFKDEEKN